MKFLLATTNLNKLREIRPVFAGLSIEILTLADLPPIAEPPETHETFWENAREKAFAYAAVTGLTAVAEDSGLEIAALNGAPGVYSARFLGANVRYADRFVEINRRLAQSRNRDARFVTALAVVQGDRVLFETEAAIDGEIARAPAGTNGFGYDPIFWYRPSGKTTAEMTAEEKAIVSHRARAFRDFARWFQGSGIRDQGSGIRDQRSRRPSAPIPDP